MVGSLTKRRFSVFNSKRARSSPCLFISRSKFPINPYFKPSAESCKQFPLLWHPQSREPQTPNITLTIWWLQKSDNHSKNILSRILFQMIPILEETVASDHIPTLLGERVKTDKVSNILKFVQESSLPVSRKGCFRKIKYLPLVKDSSTLH